ncbi:MAG: Xaa-Pro peptidase family protein [Chloroflexales bacterium]|nr:Xaa-Pro peptidase family protein [Chloroflexales bacterium]
MNTDRLARLTTAMTEQDFAAVVLMPAANLRYLTGLTFHPGKRLTLAIFPANGTTPAFVLPAMELAQAQTHAGLSMSFYPWNDADGPQQALADAIADTLGSHTKGRLLGVEYTAMRVMEMRALEHAAPGAEIVDAVPLLANLRMVKDQEELEAMTEAAQIIDAAIYRTIAQIKIGMTERELSAICTQEIKAAGGEGESFDNIIASGPNSASPHHNNTDRQFQSGDLIIIDCGARYKGYLSDITRTVVVNEPSAEARRIYELVLAANNAGRAVIRPGITGEQIDQAARTVITAGGFGDYFIHRTGHGLGLEAHEPPYIVGGSTMPLPVGATFTIEPGIYINGVGGVRIEDDVVITEEGGKSLTNFDRELIVLQV